MLRRTPRSTRTATLCPCMTLFRSWRPTTENYWGRVKKAHALEVGATVLGTRWERDHAKDKKPVLAKALEAAFAGDGATTLGLAPETAARAGAWLPPGKIGRASCRERVCQYV